MIVNDGLTPRLRAFHELIRPREYMLEATVCTIGRDQTCEMIAGVNTVSRRHAQVRRDGPRCLVADLGSVNGTFVNGERIDEPRLLEDGDEIRLGPEVMLRFADPNPTEKSSSALHFDHRRKLFMLGQQPLHLAQREFRLLDHLYHYQGQVCSHDNCMQAIWGDDYLEADDRRLSQAVYELRKRLRGAGLPADELIKTVKGEGYLLKL